MTITYGDRGLAFLLPKSRASFAHSPGSCVSPLLLRALKQLKLSVVWKKCSLLSGTVNRLSSMKPLNIFSQTSIMSSRADRSGPNGTIRPARILSMIGQFSLLKSSISCIWQDVADSVIRTDCATDVLHPKRIAVAIRTEKIRFRISSLLKRIRKSVLQTSPWVKPCAKTSRHPANSKIV